MPKKQLLNLPKLPVSDRLKSALVATAGTLIRTEKSPDEAFGDFFTHVQQGRVYDDGKTFTDLIPRRKATQINKEYLRQKQHPDFTLQQFVAQHFYEFEHANVSYKTNAGATVPEHVASLWGALERRNRLDRGSLMALPYAYVVPGGRFSEQFYWDSYFIMLGLAVDERWDLIEGMIKNYAYMIRKFGFIPTANRTYFLSRSQPPFFSAMVLLLADHKGRTQTLLEYLPYLLAEYRFWTKGYRQLDSDDGLRAHGRAVQMPDGAKLGRYYDDKSTPRPESFREDVETAERATDRESARVYLDLRAGAESGWDFSSRWFSDPQDISTIRTTDIIPVDLNCLLYQLETTIADAYLAMRQPQLERKFRRLAQVRAAAISTYMWSEKEQFFMDYDFVTRGSTASVNLAGVFPLYVKIASQSQADAVAHRLEKDFLQAGGLLTTLEDTGQQWDAPNGWAPLHWVVIQGLRAYGHHDLAARIKQAWVGSNLAVFSANNKMIEKYNVRSDDRIGVGGEYSLQDGFGWTNGVLSALLSEDS